MRTMKDLKHPMATRSYEEYATEAMLLGMTYSWLTHAYTSYSESYDAEYPHVELSSDEKQKRIAAILALIRDRTF